MLPFRNDEMRRLREEQGLTQEECGERSTLGQRRWQDIETGRYTDITASTIVRVARALDVESYDELLAPIGASSDPEKPEKPPGKAKGKKRPPAAG